MGCHCGLLEFHDYGIREMWGRAEGIASISTNAKQRCACSQTLSPLWECKMHVQACLHSKNVGVFVNRSLDMCAKCGSIEDAEKIFNSMPTCDLVLCNMMILGYVKCRQAQKALGLFQQCEWVQLVATTFVGTLNACASIEALEEGRNDT